MTKTRVVATMPVTPRHHQPLGYLHGGASVALAETVASTGGYLNAPEGKIVFGLEINANHLRPKQSGTLTAIATPIHLGRSTQVWDVKIYDEAEKLVCISRCTVAVVDAPLCPNNLTTLNGARKIASKQRKRMLAQWRVI
jgi:1,4-dihydroxy-2-naphthoyl-CoA hydrolase